MGTPGRSMKLYHFINAQYGLEAIEKRRLKVSRLEAINDPLEFSYLYSDRPEDTEALKFTLECFAANARLLCFCALFENPVMWSHYADRHRGVCLGLEVVDDGGLHKVIYSTERRLIRFPKPYRPIPDLNLARHFYQKHPSWGYEHEFRMFYERSATVREGDHRFARFSANLSLTEVIIGAFSPLKFSDVREALGGLRDVSVSRAQPSLSEVGIERGKPFPPW